MTFATEDAEFYFSTWSCTFIFVMAPGSWEVIQPTSQQPKSLIAWQHIRQVQSRERMQLCPGNLARSYGLSTDKYLWPLCCRAILRSSQKGLSREEKQEVGIDFLKRRRYKWGFSSELVQHAIPRLYWMAGDATRGLVPVTGQDIVDSAMVLNDPGVDSREQSK